VRIGPTRDVAGREDPGHARLEILIHGHAAIDGEAGAFRKRETRTNSDTRHHEIRREARTVVERDRIGVDSRRPSAQVEHDTLRLV
jgi:hypothetical protein